MVLNYRFNDDHRDDFDRRSVQRYRDKEVAGHYKLHETGEPWFIPLVFAECFLPYRKFTGTTWKSASNGTSLILERSTEGLTDFTRGTMGVPYGSRARLMLAHAFTQSMNTSSRVFVAGESWRVWLSLMGMPQCGNAISAVKEQINRFHSSAMTISNTFDHRFDINREIVIKFRLEASGIKSSKAGPERILVEISEGAFLSLARNPIKLSKVALQILGSHPMAFDIYVWLAGRMVGLKEPEFYDWKSIFHIIPTGCKKMDSFKTLFRSNLALCASVYPNANIKLHPTGIELLRSKPPC